MKGLIGKTKTHMKKQSNKTALITGATRGIGKAIAEKLAQLGYNLLLVARGEEALRHLQSSLTEGNKKIEVQIFSADLSRLEEIYLLRDWALLREPDLLVNNVSVFRPISLLNEEDDSFIDQFHLNYYSAHILGVALARSMKTKGQGHIFNISSTASREAVKAGTYTVTKHAIKGLTYVLREELRPFGVKVTEIIPGSTLTSSWDGTDISPDRFVRPDEIANTIALCLEMGSSTNIDEIVVKPQQGNLLTDC